MLEGRFPQVAGFKFSFDGSKPSGSRVIKDSITLDSGKPFNENDYYELAVVSYWADGGDDFKMLASDGEIIQDKDSLPWVIDIVLNFFQRTNKDFTPVSNVAWFINTVDVKEREMLCERLKNFGCMKGPEDFEYSPDGQFKAVKPATDGRVTIVS